MTSQPLYMKPYPVCRATYTLYMRDYSLYLCPHTQSIDNITPTLCMTSHSPYVWHCLPYTRHHILTLWPQSTVFMSSHTLYLTSCPLYLCHNTHSFDDITPFIGMTAHPLYVQYNITYIRHHTHILWDHTTLCITSHALFPDITPSISDTTSTLSVSSRPVHQLYHTSSLYDITHTLCMTLQSVCMTSHEHFMMSHRIGMTSHTVCLWHLKNIYDINATTFMKHNYTWHHTHYIWHHSHCICAGTSAVSIDHNSFGSFPLGTHMTSYTLYVTSQSHFMTSFLSIYDITATAFIILDPLHMTSPPGFMRSRPLSLWHHRHYLCEYISTLFNIKHTVQRQ